MVQQATWFWRNEATAEEDKTNVAQPLHHHSISSVSKNVHLMVWLEIVVEELIEVATSGSSQDQVEDMAATDLENDQEETPKQKQYQWKEDTHNLTDFSTDNVSEWPVFFASCIVTSGVHLCGWTYER